MRSYVTLSLSLTVINSGGVTNYLTWLSSAPALVGFPVGGDGLQRRDIACFYGGYVVNERCPFRVDFVSQWLAAGSVQRRPTPS